MIHEITDPCSVLSLYDGWEETMIWSCLQGIMGKIYADGPRRPASAAAFIGDFAFFAGEPCEELAAFRPPGYTKDFILPAARPGKRGFSSPGERKPAPSHVMRPERSRMCLMKTV